MKVDLVSRFGSQVVGVSAAGIETICDFPPMHEAWEVDSSSRSWRAVRLVTRV